MLVTVLTVLATVLFLGLLLMIVAISINNRLVGRFQRCESAFAQLKLHMVRRYEVVAQLADGLPSSPDLDHESLAVVRDCCRNAQSAEQAGTDTLRDEPAVERLLVADVELDRALRRLWRSDRDSPVDSETRALRAEFNSAESRIVFAREAYNEFAARFNASYQRFPTRLLAGKLGYKELPLSAVANKSQSTSSSIEQSGLG